MFSRNSLSHRQLLKDYMDIRGILFMKEIYWLGEGHLFYELLELFFWRCYKTFHFQGIDLTFCVRSYRSIWPGFFLNCRLWGKLKGNEYRVVGMVFLIMRRLIDQVAECTSRLYGCLEFILNHQNDALGDAKEWRKRWKSKELKVFSKGAVDLKTWQWNCFVLCPHQDYTHEGSIRWIISWKISEDL